MPALKPTEYYATITWLGVVPAQPNGIQAVARDMVEARFAGFEGEVVHTGQTRPSCVRVTAQHPRGTEIRNVRQLSVISAEELALIAGDIDVDTLDPALLGASMVISGIPNFTHVPPNARLQGPSGATITVDMENRPCILPGKEIEAEAPGHGARFKAAAKHRRGVTAWVEREGRFAIGDRLRLHVPDQPAWAHL
ncbi:sulfurase [Sulfitobacter sp. SK012]|uniref:MOSC domain-containing protein n=1 Tax=Sulfitobacter sp. SK012 TaxID=1389005 RepID=UPI000E0A0439|nr:sulfurase [Sulfitobacter sp. SK012]AXI45700.1 sulfurase [Sulfitobacter sp. SK012]